MFIEQEGHDWKLALYCSQILVASNRGYAVDRSFYNGDVISPRRVWGKGLGGDVAITPRKYAYIGLTAVDHLQHLGERRRRPSNHVFHRQHFVAQLSEYANGC